MPRTTRKPSAALDRSEQMRAVASPLRIEIIEHLQALVTQSIAEAPFRPK